MNIKQMLNKLKTLFSKGQDLTFNLARPESTLKLPSRKEFNDDTLIDFYKDEYQNTLNNMKDFEVLVLEATSLNEHMKMALDLLFAIAIKEDDARENTYEHQVEHLINYEKLKLYLQDIVTLQNEAMAILIAISEIKKESFIISKRKKDAISNVTNRLYILLNTLMGSELAIINNIQRYRKENIDFNDDVQNILAKKIKHLNWLQNALPEDKQVTIDKDNVLYSLALIEKALEEYTYTHKEEVSRSAKQEMVDKILDIPFDMEHKEKILGMVTDLEYQYRAFYEYKLSPEYKDIPIDETDLTILYSIKFNAISISKDGIIRVSFDNLDPLESEYYQNIIYKTYEDIIMGRNEIFNRLFKDDFAKAINLFKAIYKDKLSWLLSNQILLNLLFSFETPEGLSNLFKSKVSSIHLPPDYFDCVFHIDYDISIETLCYLESAIDESKENSDKYFIFNRKDLNELYKLYLKNYPSEDDIYRFPEGITSIKVPMRKSWDKLSIAQRALLYKIRKEARNKIVYLPQSLRKLDGNLFIEVPIKGIVFNEGLNHIDNGVWLTKLKTLVIPSTLKTINITAYQVSDTESIIFNISQDNAPVLSEDFLLKLFNYFQTCGWQLNEEKNKIMPPQELKEIIIHLNELDENIYIDVQKLSFDYDAQKDGQDINEAYVSKLIKYVYYILTQDRKRFALMQKVLPHEEQIAISPNIPSFLKDLEIIDKRLQKYSHEHINELNDIKAKLDPSKNNMGFSIENELGLATELVPLEAKIRLFNYYGKLDSSLINYFYKLKFIYLTKDEVACPFINDNMDDLEINAYQSIIEDTYYHLKNNSPFADEQYSDDTVASVKSLIEKILKNGKDNIDTEMVLHNIYFLNVYLALGNFNRLLSFAKSFKMKTCNYQDRYINIELNEDCLYSTICLIRYYNKQGVLFTVNGTYENLYDFIDLFHMIYVNYEGVNHKEIPGSPKNPKNFYFLPEGIVSIKANDAISPTHTILDRLIEDFKDKNIVMPNSLKSIEGDFLKVSCKSIHLNEGLQKLDLAIFENAESSVITIPSSVKDITSTIVCANGKFSEVVFNNFQFENEEVLYQILFSSLGFEKLPSGNLLSILSFKLVFHYDDLDEDIIPSLDFEEISLDLSLFEIKDQVVKKAINDIKTLVEKSKANARKRTE